MSNFTLRNPPKLSGDYKKDSELLGAWCNELYENLWLENFISTQQRKNQQGEESNV